MFIEAFKQKPTVSCGLPLAQSQIPTMNYQRNANNILVPSTPVTHRDYEYHEDGFSLLREMQLRHFWYRGRHRFLSGALDRHLPKLATGSRAIDFGGGTGAWIQYLSKYRFEMFSQLALADSSLVALTHAETVVPPNVPRYQVDLMNLQMHEEWDAAFLLDVIEHLPDDRRALEQARHALRPGGLLFVTTPAFPQLWSFNDEAVHHLRRYIRADFARLAKQTGLNLLDARYFMFFLSPIYWLSRKSRATAEMTQEDKAALMHQMHQVPPTLINMALTAIFAAETPLGHFLRFPWGTSLLGVFSK